MSDETRQLADEQFRELVTELEAGRSERLTQFLLASARFHHYSWCNVLLIACQRPGATRVAGYQTWRRFGRQVRRGEKGIAILAPIVRRVPPAESGQSSTDEDANSSNRTDRVVAFRRVFVFDVSQTDGPPLPALEAEPQGDPGGYLPVLDAAIRTSGIELVVVPSLGGALGVSEGGTIRVLDCLTPVDAFSVRVHEWAHELLHRSADRHTMSRTVRETEAEAVAYIVGRAIGIRSSVRSADYIALYNGHADLLRASLHRIQTTAAHILEQIGVGAEERNDSEPSAA